MSKCLRCGAGPEWLQGRVPSDETQAKAAAKRDAELAALRAQLAAAEKSVATLRRAYDGLAEELVDVNARLAEKTKEASRRLDELNDVAVRLTRTQGELANCRAKLAAAERERDEAEEIAGASILDANAVKNALARATAAEAALAEMTRERDAALERERAADHLRPAYQQDALEQKRLRLAAEAREAALREALRIAVNRECSCGGKGPGVEGACVACRIYHRLQPSAAPADVTSDAIDTMGVDRVYVPAAAPAAEATPEDTRQVILAPGHEAPLRLTREQKDRIVREEATPEDKETRALDALLAGALMSREDVSIVQRCEAGPECDAVATKRVSGQGGSYVWLCGAHAPSCDEKPPTPMPFEQDTMTHEADAAEATCEACETARRAARDEQLTKQPQTCPVEDGCQHVDLWLCTRPKGHPLPHVARGAYDEPEIAMWGCPACRKEPTR